jgi:hypothetical protein
MKIEKPLVNVLTEKKEDNNNKQLVMKIRHFLAVRVNSYSLYIYEL